MSNVKPILPPSPDPGARHLAGLDGLRGVAILVVMVHHFMRGAESPNWLVQTGLNVLHAGWWGVDLFFVLSGFLITGILLDAKGGAGFFRNFYMRRVLRIFPLYYGVLLGVLVLAPLLRVDTGGAFRQAAEHQGWLYTYGTNLLSSWREEAVFDYFDHFWTLAVEEHFYLLWPFVVWALPARAVGRAALGIAVGAILLRFGLSLTNTHRLACYHFTPCRLDTLAAGAMLAVAARSPEAWARCRRWAGPAATGTVTVLLAIFFKQHGLKSLDRIVQTAGYTLLEILGAALVVLSVAGHRFKRFCEFGPLRALGKYSYGLYVFHYPMMPLFLLLFPVETLARALGGQPLFGYLAFCALALTGSFAVAWVSWHLFEKRVLRLKRFFDYARVNPPSAALAAAQTARA